jgi:hypothetical protein
MSGAKHAAPQRHSRDPASRGPATNLRMYQGISLDRLAIVSWGRDRREDIHAGQRPHPAHPPPVVVRSSANTGNASR